MSLNFSWQSRIQPYRAPAWLPGGHLQTIYPFACLRQPSPHYRRTRWDTPDGDFIELDWVEGESQAPLVILFHGLEGDSGSHYASALMRAVQTRSWQGVVVHFRGCSGVPNRLPRAYHSGDAAEIAWIVQRIAAERPSAPRFAVGVSLGGNALLKWLGGCADQASQWLHGAAAVSAPVDLNAAGAALGRGVNLIYTSLFLHTLRRKSLDKLARFPGLYDAGAVRRARTLYQFDNLVTAPLHGFRDTEDYWTQASSKPDLLGITLPTLLLNARNDPFLPALYLPSVEHVAATVTLEQPDQGGHAGFVSGAFPGHLDWLPQRLLRFFTSLMEDSDKSGSG